MLCCSDHEYEPIAAPPPKIQEPHITDDLDLGPDEEFDAIKLQTKSETSSTSSRERRFLRIPLDDELVILPGDGEDEEEAMGIKSMEGENGEAKAKQLSVPDIQDDRYFTATPTTTESRTDYDVNTSQLDSSGLEDVPLKREARKKKMQEVADQQAEARGFQQRLRSQAGRIRSKLRSMPRPNIKLPERPKFNLPERPKFNLPERPKFHMPERPKFNLPERPKFNFPDRPKFHMPERPKFNFPERPKFTMPERPKFMTERPKFMTERPKFMTERPKFMTERPKFLSERPKFNLPQRPKISMPSFGMGKDRKDKPRFNSTRRPLRDRSNLSSASTTSSTKKNLFDFDFKSYPRIFDRKSRRADYATSSPKASRGQTPPPQMPSRKKGRWLQKFSDLKYEEDTPHPSASEGTGVASRVTDDLEAEEFREDIEMAEGAESVGRSESTSAFRDKDYGYAVTIDDNDRPTADDERRRMQASSSSVGEARSSGSSSLRHRAGVLEEIDSDEFFLREKGLSQEDVEVGRYLTSEIRDAFRAPVSALSQMDNYEYYDDEEDVENLGQQYRSTPERGPTRPARTRSLRPRKRTSKSKSPAEEEDSSQFFNTFPPARPKRIRRGQQQEDEELEVSKEKEGYEEQEMEVDEPAKAGIPSFTVTDDDEKYRQQSLEEPEAEEQWQTEEIAVAEPEPPMPPKRLRRGRKEPIPDTLCNGHYTKEDWLENIQAQIVPTDEVMVMRTESDYIIPAAPPEDFELPPEAPRRGRRKSSRATSLADEDRTSRGASSLPSERDHATDDFPVDLSLPEIPGYACVEKPSMKPRRKTTRPSAPGRRKRSANGHSRSYPHFYSLPHRPPPIRPLRNYSTLGPSRPPRRHKAPSSVDMDQKSESYIEIEDDILEPTSHFEESHGSARDLQSGDVVERMKGRPLPPPPRPPRKGRETRESQDELEMEDIIDGDAPLYKDDELEEPEELFDVTKEEPLGALSDKVFYAHSGVTTMEDEELEEDLPKEEKEPSPFELEKEELEKEEEEEEELLEEKELSPVLSEEKFKESSIPEDFEIEEVSIAIQTDPLPDDVCVVTGEEEVSISYATVSTETTGLEPSPPRTFDFGQQTIPIPAPPPPEPTIIEKPIPYYVMPDPDAEVELKASKLQIAELDVERLNVGELQAQKIKVSDIDGMSLQVSELTSKSGNLVLSGLELPSGFLQELIESLPMPQPVQVPVYIPVPSAPPSQTAAAEPTVSSQPLSPVTPPVTTQPLSLSSSQPVSPILVSPESTSPPQSPLASEAPVSAFVSQPVSETPISTSEEPEVTSTSAPLMETLDSSSPPDEDPPLEDPPSNSVPSPNQPSQSEPSPNSPSQSIPNPNPPSQSEPSPNSPSEPNPPTQSTPSPNPPAQSTPSPNPPAQSAPSRNSPTQSATSPNPPTQSTPSPNPPTQSTPSPNPPTQSIPSPNPPSNSASESIPLQKSAPEPKLSSPPVPDSALPPQIPSPQAPTAAEIPSPPIPQVVPMPPQLATIPPQAQTIPVQSIPLHYPNIVTSLDGLHSYISPEYLPAQVPVSVRIPSRARSHLSHSQREIESEEEMISLMHTPTSRRRRHHLSKPVARYSSDEEEEEDYGAYRPPSRRHHSSSRGAEGTVGELSRQLFHACQGVTMRALNQLVQYVSTVREGEDKRRDLQIALCILLLLVAGLILMGYGSGKTYHTHHWDYHFPPKH
ncbi:hypothetical protein C0J52_21021 [Blattella germanica]|nr:hypothetical protein C0J52_21021 [Blattella germanica]